MCNPVAKIVGGKNTDLLSSVVAIVTSNSLHLANYRAVLRGERACLRESVMCVSVGESVTTSAYRNCGSGRISTEKQTYAMILQTFLLALRGHN